MRRIADIDALRGFALFGILLVNITYLAAGKHEVLADVTRHERMLRRLQWVGFPIGLAAGVVYAHASPEHPGTAYQLFALGADVVSAPLPAAAYTASVLG
ncbi:DUF418 domain-containing protein [Streptomyces sp. NPDC004647]|uniref:DUF418 domain-containing protein n=1 Tax=Streptomyces sp. NPDC004647 TaxID=3154671 RepID=UPI0033BC1C90